MRALRADIRDGHNRVLGEAMLDGEVPLLGVRNQRWQLRGVQGKRRRDETLRARRNIGERSIRISHGLDERRVGKDILFVSAEQAGIVIYPVTHSDGRPAAAERST